MGPAGDHTRLGGAPLESAEGGPHGIIIQAPRRAPSRTRVRAYLWEGVPTAEWPVVLRVDQDVDSPSG